MQAHRLLIILGILLMGGQCFAQQWPKVFNFKNSWILSNGHLSIAYDGALLLTGSLLDSAKQRNLPGFVIKLDRNGEKLWNKPLGSPKSGSMWKAFVTGPTCQEAFTPDPFQAIELGISTFTFILK